MKRLGYAPRARAELAAIGRYIAQDDPDRALSFVGELEAKAAQAAERPLSFRRAMIYRPVCAPLVMAST